MGGFLGGDLPVKGTDFLESKGKAAAWLLHFAFIACKAHVLFGAGKTRFEFGLELLAGRILQALVVKHGLTGLERLVLCGVYPLLGNFWLLDNTGATAGAVNSRQGGSLGTGFFLASPGASLRGLAHLTDLGGAFDSDDWLGYNLWVAETAEV